MIPNYKRYSLVIRWSNEDQAYLVTVPELPRVITHGETYEEAVKQGLDAIETWLDFAQEAGIPIPPPEYYEDSAD